MRVLEAVFKDAYSSMKKEGSQDDKIGGNAEPNGCKDENRGGIVDYAEGKDESDEFDNDLSNWRIHLCRKRRNRPSAKRFIREVKIM